MRSQQSYQEQCVEQIRDAYRRGHKSVLLALPTGGGKTICFSFVVENAVAKGAGLRSLSTARNWSIRQATASTPGRRVRS